MVDREQQEIMHQQALEDVQRERDHRWQTKWRAYFGDDLWHAITESNEYQARGERLQ